MSPSGAEPGAGGCADHFLISDMNKRRKNIRLEKETYQDSSQVFSLTICTRDRQPLFLNLTWAKIVLDSLKTGPFGQKTKRYAYCLMPDHLHILIACCDGNLVDLVNRWKSYTANLLRKNRAKGPCWQRGFYDHALRREEDIQRTAEYIVNNPVRAGLVEKSNDYPFLWHRWM
jgi:putative transposase